MTEENKIRRVKREIYFYLLDRPSPCAFVDLFRAVTGDEKISHLVFFEAYDDLKINNYIYIDQESFCWVN